MNDVHAEINLSSEKEIDTLENELKKTLKPEYKRIRLYNYNNQKNIF